MTDYNRPATTYDETNRTGGARRPVTTTVTAGAIFGSMDIAAVVAWAVMNLGPLFMAAFAVPHR